MAVAAYASLVSLTHVLDNVHYRAELRRLHVDIKQIEDLQGRVNFLLEFVEVHSEIIGERIESLWRQISEVAFEAEEAFDLHVVSQLQLGAKGRRSDLGFLAFSKDMEGLIQKIDSIKNELLAVEEVFEDLRIGKQPTVSRPTAGSLVTSRGGKNTIVGFDKHVVRIMDVLTRDESDLQFLSIVGMGGNGKTTPAKKVFDDPCIVHHFNLRIWLTISQEYSVHKVLTGLLNDGVVDAKAEDENLDKLGESLRKKLFHRRYLIVMDDVWTEQPWNDLRILFPNNFNRSRVMMTTRLSHVAKSLGSHNLYSMTCLDENESWGLFCQIIFGQKDCPDSELEKIGMKIVKSCKGLPLEIIVLGGLLGKPTNMREEYWKLVAKNVSSFANSSEDNHCSEILRLSYNNLPLYLKPCFLYMRVFDEDKIIFVSDLIKYWVDEGYIKIKGDRCLEEIAREYVKDLVDRNLIFIRGGMKYGEIEETCGIHDLLRDLCLSEYDKEHFMCFPRVEIVCEDERMGDVCSICTKYVDFRNETHPWAANIRISPFLPENPNPPVCGPCRITYSHTNELRWVEVIGFYTLHTKLRRAIVQSRHDDDFASHPMIHFLWNLQTLILDNVVHLPCQIWEMPQLRHIQAEAIYLPAPPIAHGKQEDFFILKNLYTLRQVRNFVCTHEVLNRIPNLKELGVGDHRHGRKLLDASCCNIVQFQKLELLLVRSVEFGKKIEIAFPLSLKKLSLDNCSFPWSCMSIIGSLPNLENLILLMATKGSEWNPIEGEFLRLKELSIKCKDLVQWTAEESHFPNLELLQLLSLSSLEEIPSGIGDIPTLLKIMLHECSISAINSAHRIWEDQQRMGNETLEILVYHNEKWQSIGDFMSLQIKDDEDEGNDDDDNNDNDDEASNNINSDDEDDDNDVDIKPNKIVKFLRNWKICI